VSYKTSRIPTYYLYKTASIQFIDTNIAGNIKVNTTNTTSLVTQQLLHPTILKHLTYILPQDAITLQLYYIRFIIASNKLILGTPTLLSKYFFVNRDFSLFTPQIYKARDMLLNSPAVIIYFFTLGTK
jgi:hypothetical protein